MSSNGDFNEVEGNMSETSTKKNFVFVLYVSFMHIGNDNVVEKIRST